jgi:protein associated with RNAse G/E
MVDMDLDVIQSAVRGVFVDDEDEFEEHRVSMGYPQELVEAVRTECTRLFDAVRDGRGPFGGAADEWMAQGRASYREDLT